MNRAAEVDLWIWGFGRRFGDVVLGVSLSGGRLLYGAVGFPRRPALTAGMHMSDLDRRLAELASRQHGTFSARTGVLTVVAPA